MRRIDLSPGPLHGATCAALVMCCLGGTQKALGQEVAFSDQFALAHQATGDSYLKIRDAIVDRGDEALGFLRRERESPLWETRLLAEILIERVTHQEQVDSAIRAGIGYPGRRETYDQVMAGGKALAVAFKSTPMVLTEFIWKSNELRDISTRNREPRYPLRDRSYAKAYAAWALGVLRERRASHILLHAMETGDERNTKLFAGKAVGLIGDPRAFDDLLRIIRTSKDNIVRGAAWNAISGCLDESSIPKLKAAAEAAQDPK